MVRHLSQKVTTLERLARPGAGDAVLDIGSNDATTLRAYSTPCRRIGIDPTGHKFRAYYGDEIALIPSFFSAGAVRAQLSDARFKIITSIAMFYDLERPTDFVRDIAELLADDGVWHFEQSYMPSMLRTNSYDTICHEHLEFYSFEVVKRMVEDAGLRVVDVQMNAINGGSFAVTVCKKKGPFASNTPVIEWLLKQEANMGLHTPRPYREFEERVFRHRRDLRELIEALVASGRKVFGYGASTKGNVLLQFCGLTTAHIPFIAEVNEEKFGAYTPGTGIPIISEAQAKEMKPDYFLVLPWHFKPGIVEREKEFLAQGGKMIFPLPEIEIV
jgi:hypothetical protein